jgi:diguanylate cyclase (GGDEF)-like protein
VLSEVLALSEGSGDVGVRGRTLVNLARVHAHLGRHREALEASEQALGLLHGPENEIQALMAAGIVHHECGSLEEATRFLQAALEIAESINSKALAHHLHRHLSQVHKAAARSDAALWHYERFHALEREVLADEAERRVRASTAQRETERARAESEIFRLRNVELAKAMASLKDADRQKSDLLHKLHEKSDELERQVREDGLTGVFNRRHLETALASEFSRCRSAKLPLSVAMIDVDHFKAVNDRFSHQVGDRVLVQMATLLQNAIRGQDLVARYGGEEFVIAMPETDGSQALIICERLRRTIEDHDWSGFHPELRITISIGVSDDPQVQNHEKLLHLADVKLYEAKRAGRNCIKH